MKNYQFKLKTAQFIGFLVLAIFCYNSSVAQQKKLKSNPLARQVFIRIFKLILCKANPIA